MAILRATGNVGDPYLADRQWGTVRENYSPDGAAWDYFPHDSARSRAYRWGEDGIAGISDNHQRLCLAISLQNGADPIIKERLFGLSGNEGNHGEDVKEYYFYLDNTPTHSYLGNDFLVECPTGSGQMMNLEQVATNLSQRLVQLFLQNDASQPPFNGGVAKFQTDPHWCDLILFHEYFHSDNGAGLGASHQTGWTGLIATLFEQSKELIN